MVSAKFEMNNFFHNNLQLKLCFFIIYFDTRFYLLSFIFLLPLTNILIITNMYYITVISQLDGHIQLLRHLSYYIFIYLTYYVSTNVRQYDIHNAASYYIK